MKKDCHELRLRIVAGVEGDGSSERKERVTRYVPFALIS